MPVWWLRLWVVVLGPSPKTVYPKVGPKHPKNKENPNHSQTTFFVTKVQNSIAPPGQPQRIFPRLAHVRELFPGLVPMLPLFVLVAFGPKVVPKACLGVNVGGWTRVQTTHNITGNPNILRKCPPNSKAVREQIISTLEKFAKNGGRFHWAPRPLIFRQTYTKLHRNFKEFEGSGVIL